MGGKDIIYMKQQHSSPLQPAEVQKILKDMADKRFVDATGKNIIDPEKIYEREKVCLQLKLVCVRVTFLYCWAYYMMMQFDDFIYVNSGSICLQHYIFEWNWHLLKVLLGSRAKKENVQPALYALSYYSYSFFFSFVYCLLNFFVGLHLQH